MPSQELRDELKKRNLDTSGTKPILLARLEEASQAPALPAADESSSAPQKAAADTAAAAVPAGTASSQVEYNSTDQHFQ